MGSRKSVDNPWDAPLYTTLIKTYIMDGTSDVLCARHQCFREPGYTRPAKKHLFKEPRGETDKERSKRRAKQKLFETAMSSRMEYFVTLTLDPEKIDRYDMKKVLPKLTKWLTNAVERKGLSYLIVPEYHKDGAIHFHGLITKSMLDMVDSGTMWKTGCKKPRRVSKRKRSEFEADGWHVVYNMPNWTLGFTTAIKLHGDYRQAVNYVVKYISKLDDKIGGRWYYRGGSELYEPVKYYDNLRYDEIAALTDVHLFEIPGIDQFAKITLENIEMRECLDLDVLNRALGIVDPPVDHVQSDSRLERPQCVSNEIVYEQTKLNGV